MGVIGVVLSVKKKAFGAAKTVVKLPFALFRSTPQPRCDVDHLVYGYTCGKLDEGIATVEELTGVRAEFGGAHPGAGTHNALLSLGKTAYLEIIAPDPNQCDVKAAAKFFMDDPSMFNSVVAYAVHPNAGEDIEELRAILGAGEVGDRCREEPNGSILNWRMTPATEAKGARPWLIDWGSSAHPATTTPKGCQLMSLEFSGPDAEAVGKLLTSSMKLGGSMTFTSTSEGRSTIKAKIKCPKGTVYLC